jgi:hypothetical protein
LPAVERIVVDVRPSVKKKLSKIATVTETTMKEVLCKLIESKYEELGLEENGGENLSYIGPGS